MPDQTLAAQIIAGLVLVGTTPALLGVVLGAVIVTWALRGWLARNQISDAESGKTLFKDRYELEKQSHDALKAQIKDPAIIAAAFWDGPEAIRDMVVRLGSGEKIETPVNPVGTQVGHTKKDYPLLQIAALANTTASGFSTVQPTSTGTYRTTGTASASDVLIIHRPGKVSLAPGGPIHVEIKNAKPPDTKT